jgi:hypothetical protein
MDFNIARLFPYLCAMHTIFLCICTIFDTSARKKKLTICHLIRWGHVARPLECPYFGKKSKMELSLSGFLDFLMSVCELKDVTTCLQRAK